MKLFSDHFLAIYGGQSVENRGRRTALIAGITQSCISVVNTGLLYTGFFMLYGIDIVNIGILMLAPYLASVFSVFAPLILERFRRRKRLLIATRALSYFLSIVTITILPPLIRDKSAMIAICVIVSFLSNALNCFCQAGFDAWHIHFLPDYVRADHFSFRTLISSFIGQGIAFLTSFVVDTLPTDIQSAVLIGVRWLLAAIAIYDLWNCSRPPEPEYRHSVEKLRLSDVFLLPLKNGRFMGTLGLYCMFNFFYYLSYSTLSYYLLNDCKASYTFISGMDMIYPFTLLIFLPMWKRYLRTSDWLTVFALSAAIFGVSYLAYGFVNAGNYIVIMLIVRTVQHLAGAGNGITSANLMYLNTPETDRTGYLSFYTVCSNLSMFLGMLCGTALVGWIGERGIQVGSVCFAPVQLLLFLTGVGLCVTSALVLLSRKRLTPPAKAL